MTRRPANSRSAVRRFFLGVGRLRRASEARCQYTIPLFSLVLILEADRTLRVDCKHLVGVDSDPEPITKSPVRAVK